MRFSIDLVRRFWSPAQSRRSRALDERVARAFDAEFYLGQYPDIAAAGVSPLHHYLKQGWREGRDPSPSFSTQAYLRAHPELKAAGICPLVHFVRSGASAVVAVTNAASAIVPGRLEEQLRDAALARRAYTTMQPDAVQGAVEGLNRRSGGLPLSDEPEVSIVVSAQGGVGATLACLDSVLRHASTLSAEVIVVGDGALLSALVDLEGARQVQVDIGVGFADAFGRAFEMARGRYLVQLDGDTQVLDGWLDELIGSFAVLPKAGLVGSKLVTAHGATDATAGSGQGLAADDPRVSFAQQVAWRPAGSVAISAALLREVGGLNLRPDEAGGPVSDLASRVREAGAEVWVQPLSAVIHHQPTSDETDLTVGMQHAGHPSAAGERDSVAAAGEQDQRRILIIDTVTPTPDRDSGSFITDRLIAAYQALGYRVTFIPLLGFGHAGAYTEALQRRGVECIYDPFVASLDDFLARGKPDFDAVLVFRYHNLNAALEALRRAMPNTPVILHTVDLHFVREQREAELFQSRDKRLAALRVKYAELEAAARADVVVVHTPVERDRLVAEIGEVPIVVFPYVAETQPSPVPFEPRRDILFLGGFGHSPNGDAVRYFLDEIWPALEHALPEDASFVVVGMDPPADLLPRATERVRFVGQVEQLAPWFERARVFVAPLRYGAGIKGKLIQALAHGVPVVATPIATEGMGLTEGREVIVAEDGAAFATAVERLYGDRAKWSSLRASGLDFVSESYSWQRCLDSCAGLVALAHEVFEARLEARLRAPLDALLQPPSGGNRR